MIDMRPIRLRRMRVPRPTLAAMTWRTLPPRFAKPRLKRLNRKANRGHRGRVKFVTLKTSSDFVASRPGSAFSPSDRRLTGSGEPPALWAFDTARAPRYGGLQWLICASSQAAVPMNSANSASASFHCCLDQRYLLIAFIGSIVFSAGAVVDKAVAASEPTIIKLWEGVAPGTPATKPEDEPVLLMSQPDDKSARVPTAIIVLPGGGYGGLAMDHEGQQIAEWLNSLGITAFILKYRMHGTGHMHPVPMMDGQRAIRLVRTRAKEWGIDPARIGVLGFSAGGHLTSTLATHFDSGKVEVTDGIDRASSRPDFAVLCYPVISTTAEYAHKGSVKNLLGEHPDPALLKSLSNETQVTPQTPPIFIFQTSEDKGVPAENCIAFYLACHKAGVPVEMHIFQNGRHGVGLAKDIAGTRQWPELCREWLKVRGLLDAANIEAGAK